MPPIFPPNEQKTGKKAKPGAPEESSVSEVSEISETSGFSSTGNDTNVKMNPNPERKTGGSGQPPSRPTQPPRSPQNGPGPLQPQEVRQKNHIYNENMERYIILYVVLRCCALNYTFY